MKAIKRLFDIPYYQLKTFPLKKAFSQKHKGQWTGITTQNYINQSNAISRGLLRLGVKPNDKIAMISMTNRTEWNICDIGILQIGAQNVPIYPTISEEDYLYILNHSESKYCFVSCDEILTKINKIRDRAPALKEVFCFDQLEHGKHWSEILKLGEDSSNQKEVEARKEAVLPDDLATIIYTSGTTGQPKGVMLSHDNIVTNIIASEKKVPLAYGKDKALSFLPVSHIFERLILYLYQYCGVEIYFAESIEKMGDNLKEIKPHVMTAVPRLYEKVYDKIYTKGTELSWLKQKLFFWAVNLGLKFEPYGANGWWYELKLALARKLIFSKWQEGMGGNIKIMVSGSAPLQPRLSRIFAAAGLPIMEGYGLTETSPVITVNDLRYGDYRIGTVGRLIEGVEMKIAKDGETMVKGPNIMLGYYKNPKLTAEVMSGDYFHTGDIGEVSPDGFLKITDRKKEMFKTSGGKYIAPALIESKLRHSRFIEQVMVIGEGEKMPAALIQLNFSFAKEWCQRHDIDINSISEMTTNPQLIKRIQEEIDHCNKNFGKWEQIKRFELTPEEWTIEEGHLTPTLKMKRKIIKEIYKELHQKIYRC